MNWCTFEEMDSHRQFHKSEIDERMELNLDDSITEELRRCMDCGEIYKKYTPKRLSFILTSFNS